MLSRMVKHELGFAKFVQERGKKMLTRGRKEKSLGGNAKHDPRGTAERATLYKRAEKSKFLHAGAV